MRHLLQHLRALPEVASRLEVGQDGESLIFLEDPHRHATASSIPFTFTNGCKVFCGDLCQHHYDNCFKPMVDWEVRAHSLTFAYRTPTLKSRPYPLSYLVTYIRSDRVLGSSPISLLSASRDANSAKVRSQLFPY